MTLAIDLTSLSDNFSGLERMALELSKALILQAGEEESFVLVIKNSLPPMLNNIKNPRVRFVRIKGKNKLLANQLTLPLTMARIKADAYIFPAFPVPLLFRKKNTYGMIADLGCYDCPQTMKKKQVLFFREGAKHTARVSRKTLTISDFSAGRIEEILKLPKEKILMLYCGINLPEADRKKPERVLAVKEKYGLPRKYLLSLSTLEPRKNLKLLIDAYLEVIKEDAEIPLPPLVLAGRPGWLMEEEIRKASEDGHILFPGFIDDEDLPALYAGAECFIFPSLYEGFGMPPLEAQAAGVQRILSSDTEALREVLGDTAGFFSNNDKASLKQALRELSSLPVPEAGSVAANLERFSWKAAAEKLRAELRDGK
ncbi:MAG: glycosyltransferase family 4 protein [Lachnospiraceae bacterium]|nr:glycosyltransferase family 4 protein [Lachnospiraceae bacterium]